ncbi:MAG: helix-turn-helix domain-containing protein [Tardiphaga sp.]
MEMVSFDGFEVTLAQLSLSEAERWDSTMPAGIWCGVLTEGSIATARAGSNNTWVPRTVINYGVEAPMTVEHVVPQSCQLSAVFIRIPLDRIDAIAGPDGGRLLAPTNSDFRVWHDHGQASALAWQMLGSPLSGSARRLYLSGKALEILSTVSQSVSADQAGQTRAVGASPRANEIERVHEARALILAALSDPPSVPQLAKSVGLNAHRLGELFKLVFGMSVYAYAKAARLDQARLLLEAGEITVSQAAYGSGYHPAHFSTEFRKRFGFSPSAVNKRGRSGSD